MIEENYQSHLRGRQNNSNIYESSRKSANRKTTAINDYNFDYTPLRSNSPNKDDIKCGVVNLSSNNQTETIKSTR